MGNERRRVHRVGRRRSFSLLASLTGPVLVDETFQVFANSVGHGRLMGRSNVLHALVRSGIPTHLFAGFAGPVEGTAEIVLTGSQELQS